MINIHSSTYNRHRRRRCYSGGVLITARSMRSTATSVSLVFQTLLLSMIIVHLLSLYDNIPTADARRAEEDDDDDSLAADTFKLEIKTIDDKKDFNNNNPLGARTNFVDFDHLYDKSNNNKILIIDNKNDKQKRKVMTPFFWYIPISANAFMKEFTNKCLNLVIASEVGGKLKDRANVNQQDMDSTSQIRIVADINGDKHINIDTSTLDGMKYAKEIGFIEKNYLADVIYSVHIHNSASYLFNEIHQGIFFAILRHPIDRAVSLFHYKQNADKSIKDMTLEEYEKSGRAENNWMVRMINNQYMGTLNGRHLKYAKHFLKTKAIIGLYKDIETSMRRFGHVFGWDTASNDENKWEMCLETVIKKQGLQKEDVKIQHISKNSNDYKAVVDNNYYDLLLYRYAVRLFQNQTMHFQEV